MKFKGELYTYDTEHRSTAFEANPDCDKALVFIGGLGDGYNAVPFLEPLYAMLIKLGWSFVQVQLESSYDGYGTSNLQTDSQQLDLLVEYLKTERNKSTIVFLGHSTGSQDCYWHNKYGQNSSSVSGYILQAPVSDRQHFAANLDHFEASLALAIQLRNEGKGDELLPRKALDAPVTADRFYSFAARLGDDDVFSTDFTDEEIKRLFADLHQPICWVYSEKDEFYASDKDKTLVMHRFQSLCPAIVETHNIPEGDHSITRKDSQEAFCLVVEGFLNRFSS